MTEAKKSIKRTLICKVVSDKRAKTVTVLVERRVKHEQAELRRTGHAGDDSDDWGRADRRARVGR